VARELPSKTEQTVYCVLEPEQRKLYDELRQTTAIRCSGGSKRWLAKSKIQVLEALFACASCLPSGLHDSKRSSDSPAPKLDVLLEQLREVLDEDTRRWCSRSFTSLLKILRARLNQDGMLYEYLDGPPVTARPEWERFQNDKDCRLFLVSPEGRGLGLESHRRRVCIHSRSLVEPGG